MLNIATGRVIKRNGKWAYVISLPYDPQKGRYPQRWRSGFETKKAAQEAMTKDLTDLDVNAASKATMTVKDYLEDWLTRSVAGRNSPRTLETYQHTCNSFIIPYIGNVKLNSITPNQIEEMYKKLAERVQPSSVHRAHRVLRAALNRAVKRGILTVSPMVRVESPSSKTTSRKPLGLSDIAQILTHLKQHHPVTYVATQLAISTGMRRGELCGLTWNDFDEERHMLRVVRSRQRRNGVDIVGAPKTAASIRQIPIGNQVIQLLRDWNNLHQQHTQERGVPWNNDDFILQRIDGFIIDPMTLSRDFRKAIIDLQLPEMSFHDLRHLHATMLLEAGFPAKVVQERLGHSSITMTMNTYSHVTETMQEKAVEKLEEALKNI